MGQSSERERDRQSFRELAKLAPQRPKQPSFSGVRRAEPGKRSEDSGMIDLAKLAASEPGAVDRASVTPMASSEPPSFGDEITKIAPPPRGFEPFGDEVTRIAPPPAALLSSQRLPDAASSAPGQAMMPAAPSRPSTLPVSVSSRDSATPFLSAQAALAAAPAPQRRGAGRTIAFVVALAAVAAGSFFAVRSLQHPGAASSSSTVAKAEAPAAQPQATGNVAPPPLAPAADPGIDPLSLPKKDLAAAVAHHAGRGFKASHNGQSLVAKADPKASKDEEESESAPEPAAPKAPEARQAVAAAEPAPAAQPAPANALLSSIKAATDSNAAPAAANDTPVPAAAAVGGGAGGSMQRPSQGAVTGALGAVLPAARECLGEDDGVSRARVIFGSDGSVQSVSLTGFAAGKPSEACIKGALSKAHVPPFAEASYGATVTVRP